MNETNNTTQNGSTTIPWQAKVKYIGAGLFIGVVIAPLVRKALAQIQPKIDEAFEHITGKTESYAESASDLLHKAKEHLKRSPDHHHEKPWPKSPQKAPKPQDAPQDHVAS